MSMKPEKWETFSDAGMLWWVNRILHTFGWSIVLEYGGDGGKGVSDAYPARTDWLGFPDDVNEEMLKRFQQHVEHEDALRASVPDGKMADLHRMVGNMLQDPCCADADSSIGDHLDPLRELYGLPKSTD